MRNLNKGIGKYKGKLPFKCFNCGKIVHFSSKCHYAKRSDINEENEKKYQKRNKKFVKRKTLYSKEHSSSSNDEDDSDDESGKVLFMDLEEITNDDEEDYADGEVDIEVELIISLSELKKEK